MASAAATSMLIVQDLAGALEVSTPARTRRISWSKSADQ